MVTMYYDWASTPQPSTYLGYFGPTCDMRHALDLWHQDHLTYDLWLTVSHSGCKLPLRGQSLHQGDKTQGSQDLLGSVLHGVYCFLRHSLSKLPDHNTGVKSLPHFRFVSPVRNHFILLLPDCLVSGEATGTKDFRILYLTGSMEHGNGFYWVKGCLIPFNWASLHYRRNNILHNNICRTAEK